MKSNDIQDSKRFEAVCLAISGKGLGEIARHLHVSRTRAQQMIIQQAGVDFYAQLQLEWGKKRGRYKGNKLLMENAKGQLIRQRTQ